MNSQVVATPSATAPERIKDALLALSGVRAVVLGDFVLDTYLYGETGRVSREAPVLVMRKQHVEHRLGGAANTAANLAALGVDTTLVGVLGGDAEGEQLHQMLQARGINTDHTLSVSQRITPVKTRIMAGAFGTSKQQILRLDNEPVAELPADLVDAVCRELLAKAYDADVIVVSDYGLGCVGTAVQQALQKLAAQGQRICVDSRYQLSAFAGITAITPNVPEAEDLLGFALKDEAAAARAAQQLVERLDLQACLLTQGRHGMVLCQRHADQTIGYQSTQVSIVGAGEVTDVTGAGDTVIATFSAALAAGLGMHNAMLLANCAAGVVVTKMGCAQAQPSELSAAAVAGGVELLPWDVSQP